MGVSFTARLTLSPWRVLLGVDSYCFVLCRDAVFLTHEWKLVAGDEGLLFSRWPASTDRTQEGVVVFLSPCSSVYNACLLLPVSAASC